MRRLRGFLAGALMLTASLAATTAAAAPDLAVYGRLPAFETAAISASGRYVAIISEVDGVRRLLVTTADNKLITSAPIGTMKVRELSWAGDDYILVHYRTTLELGEGFNTDLSVKRSVMVVPLDHSPSWSVFDGIKEIASGTNGEYGLIKRDGCWYGYFGGITLHYNATMTETTFHNGVMRPDLYEVDLQTHKAKLIAQRHGADEVKREWLLKEDGTVAATLDASYTTGVWTIYDGKHARLASGGSPQNYADLIGFAPDGQGLVYATGTRLKNDARWFTVPLAGGTPQPFLQDQDVNRPLLDGAHRLIGYYDDHDVHLFDTRRNNVVKATQKAFPDAQVHFISQSDDFQYLIVSTDGVQDPITWWLVNISTGDADVIGHGYAIAPADVGPMHMVPYTAADGLKMEGVLTLPPGSAKQPLAAIVLPHGGPAAHDNAGFDWLAQAFASRGYAVFQPNFRGSTGYGQAFEEAGRGQWGQKMQTDISDGLAQLVRQGIVDPARVCIMGASYGGYSALAGVTMQQGLYRCAVSISGVSDLDRQVSQEGGGLRFMQNNKASIGGTTKLSTISPISYADKAAVPILLIHGKDDIVVDPSQSSAMADALRRAGKQVELVAVPGEDHWLSNSATRQSILEKAMTFITKHNPAN